MVDIWQRKSRKVLIISCSISFIYYLNFKEGKINSKSVPPKLKKKCNSRSAIHMEADSNSLLEKAADQLHGYLFCNLKWLPNPTLTSDKRIVWT